MWKILVLLLPRRDIYREISIRTPVASKSISLMQRQAVLGKGDHGSMSSSALSRPRTSWTLTSFTPYSRSMKLKRAYRTSVSLLTYTMTTLTLACRLRSASQDQILIPPNLASFGALHLSVDTLLRRLNQIQRRPKLHSWVAIVVSWLSFQLTDYHY